MYREPVLPLEEWTDPGASHPSSLSMSPRRTSSPGRRAVKRTVLTLAGLFILLYIVLPQWAAQKATAERLQHVNPLLLLLAVGLQILSLLAYTILTRVTLPPEPKLSMWTLFRIQLATKSVGNVVPGGSAAGGTLGFRLLTEAGVSNTAAGFTLATVGLGSAVVLNLILWLGLLISIPFNGFKPVYLTAALVGVLLLIAAAALVYLLMEGRHRADNALRAIARRIPFVEEETASRFVHQLAERLQDLTRQPELVRNGALWAAANWLLDASSLWVFLMAFGETVNPVNLIVAYGLAGVLAALPLTPGGLGVVETVLPATLAGFGVAPGVALAGVLSWRFVQFWLPIPLGGLAYVSLRFGRFGRATRAIERSGGRQPFAEGADLRVWDENTGEYRLVTSAEGTEADPADPDSASAGAPSVGSPSVEQA